MTPPFSTSSELAGPSEGERVLAARILAGETVDGLRLDEVFSMPDGRWKVRLNIVGYHDWCQAIGVTPIEAVAAAMGDKPFERPDVSLN